MGFVPKCAASYVQAAAAPPPSGGAAENRLSSAGGRKIHACIAAARGVSRARIPMGLDPPRFHPDTWRRPPPLPPPPATFRTDTRAHLFRRRRPARWRTTMERAPIRFVAGMRPQHRGCRTLERKREFAIRVDSCSAGG